MEPDQSVRMSPQLELRPLSTGELLDRVFFLYRSRPVLFWGVALVPACTGLLGSAAQVLVTHGHIAPSGVGAPLSMMRSFSTSLVVMLSSLLSILGYALAQAATSQVTMQLTLGQPAAAGQALRAEFPLTLRYIGIELWKVGSASWLPTIFFGFGALALARHQRGVGALLLFLSFCAAIYGFIAYIRNSLAIPASVVEALRVAPSMRRSKVLVAGRKWRIFLLLLLLMVLYIVAGLISVPFSLLLAHAREPVRVAASAAISLGVSFLITLLLTPIASIALCLFYFDERVRREGFDIDVLLRGPEAARQAPPAAGLG